MWVAVIRGLVEQPPLTPQISPHGEPLHRERCGAPGTVCGAEQGPLPGVVSVADISGSIPGSIEAPIQLPSWGITPVKKVSQVVQPRG